MARHLLATVSLIATIALVGSAHAELPPRASVPPSLEIEILDPNVDPNGNPAVVLEADPCSDGCLVDIPPVVLVHRYYYTGNRSFQGPMLPGGPSIAVINHPKTGERCYVPLQMMPGAPTVRYHAKSIEYDYGKHGISIEFGLLGGAPTVEYRSHEKVGAIIDHALQASKLPEAKARMSATAGRVIDRTGIALRNTAIFVEKGARTVALPAVNVVQVLPFGKMIFCPNPERASGAYAEQFRHDKEVRQASADMSLRDTSLPTNR